MPSATVNRTSYTDQPARLTALSGVGQSDRSITMTKQEIKVAGAVTMIPRPCMYETTHRRTGNFRGHDIFAISRSGSIHVSKIREIL